MDLTPSIPAAWYDDPAGSGGQRWWDGTVWTDHVRPPEVPAFPVFQPSQLAQPIQPADPVAITAYNPFQGHISPGTIAWNVDSSPAAVPVNNSAGWTSLAAGVIGLGIVVASSMLGQTVYVLYLPLVIAVVFGIRSLVQRASGKSTSLVAPILGILCGLVAAVMFLSVVLTGALPFTQPGLAGFDAESLNEKFPNSPELAVMYGTANDIQLGLHDQYPGGSYPQTLTADDVGVIDLNGVTIGTIASGQVFVYKLIDPTTFSFTIIGTQRGERMVYDSSRNELIVQCYAEDTACEMVS
jgi:hypothetical protein